MEVNKQLTILNAAIIIVGGIGVIGGTVMFVRANIFRPKVVIDSVDYSTGIAQLHIGGKSKTLYKNSTIAAGATWGVRFNGNDPNHPTRIELVKDNLVFEILT